MNNFRNNRKNRFKSNGERNFRKRPLSGSRNISEFSNSDLDTEIQEEIIKMPPS